MNKWNMIVDVAKCENCHNCTLSVKDEHVDNNFPGYAAPQPQHGHDWIKITRNVRGSSHMVDTAYLPTMCNHCDDAPCLKVGGKDGAVKKRRDGIMIIDPEKAKGRKDIAESCPHNAIAWNEELEIPQIWIFDAHLLDNGWKEPRASQCCPTDALEAVKISDSEMKERVVNDKLETLLPELGLKPRIYYKNLHRYAKHFLGGTIVTEASGQRECLSGATVNLQQDNKIIDTQSSDMFGDFKFDKLEAGHHYTIEVTCVDHSIKTMDVALGKSIYLGEIELT
ncbi:MAG: hypothetical protein JKY45_02300 [Emcibacter sp.]|nr:hypothetical protein [Emcibacter sp.]